ncbi:putative phosphatidate cytidylyltransferase [Mycobacterium kansasii]|uniref:Putative phosphatidate cytidylyltransferase n=1 Tax=Mycobacterium kansasii TaxID=1768 RepID=A0A1V3XSQ4_MYCKA|nr:putative phosphatidate cytidylyltransferase [Mycobacterium kansasii]
MPAPAPGRRPAARAEEDLPGRTRPAAAIAVGSGIGAVLVATLLLAPRGWVAICALAMAVASHEVVRRLREAGYLIPVIPLLVGGQVTIWLSWPYGARGVLAGFGAMVVVCMIWRLFMQDKRSDGGAERAAPGTTCVTRRPPSFWPRGWCCSAPSLRCWSTTAPAGCLP